MIFYHIRKDSEVDFTVSKWDGGVLPLVVYRVRVGKGVRPSCSCPSGSHRGYCKHPQMVKSWIKKGMPIEEINAVN